MRDAQDDFIDSQFLPAGQKIKDPSKLQSVEADQLLDFWYQRQKSKNRPTFAFKAWQNHDREMKEPVENMDGTGDSEDSNTDEDTQANRPTSKPTARPTTKPTARPTTKPTARPTAKLTARPPGKPTGKGSCKQTTRINDSSSEDEYVDDEEDEEEEPKHDRKRARVNQVESEPEDHPPLKKSKATASRPQPVGKPATGSGKSSGRTHKSPRRSFGPMSGVQTRARQEKHAIAEPAPAPTGSGIQAIAAKDKRVIKPSLKNSVNKYTYR